MISRFVYNLVVSGLGVDILRYPQNIMLEAKCSSRAINYPTGASYQLCNLLHTLCILEEVGNETMALDKVLRPCVA